jgi:hypothetical protein
MSNHPLTPRALDLHRPGAQISPGHNDATQCILEIKQFTPQLRMPVGYKGTSFKGLAICKAVQRRGQIYPHSMGGVYGIFLRRKSTCLNCAGITSDRQMEFRGVLWEQDTPTGTVWHRSRPAPAPERVSHCTLAQAHLGRLAGIKAWAGSSNPPPQLCSPI